MRRSYCRLSIPEKGFIGKIGTNFLARLIVIGQGIMILEKEGWFGLDVFYIRLEVFYNVGGRMLEQVV